MANAVGHRDHNLAMGDTMKKLASPTIAKIQSFAKLPKGWTFGNADPVNDRVIDLALRVERMLRERVTQKLMPSPVILIPWR